MSHPAGTAWTQQKYGGPETLSTDTLPISEPGPAEVTIQVEAAGLNAADVHLMHGEPLLLRLFFGLRRPRAKVPGRDVSGTVLAVGSKVHSLTPGDAVFGEIPGGAFATHATVPADLLVRRPAELSATTAASIALAGGTAEQALTLAGVTAGNRVLVISAGGVGTFAIQLAAARGAEVWVLCGSRALTLARELGASQAFDYKAVDPAAESPELPAGSFDTILDIAGVSPLRSLRRLLAPGGTLVLVAGNGGRVLGPIGRILRAMFLGGGGGGRRIKPLAATTQTELSAKLAHSVAEDELRVVIEREWPFPELPAALSHMADGHAVGKHVVTM